MASRRPPRGPDQGLFDFAPQRAPIAQADDEGAPLAVLRGDAPAALEKDEPRVFGVAELVRSASRTLEARFPSVWVEGEVTNLSRPRSGHIYFSLTETDACLPSVMFRTQAVRMKFELQEGQRVRARGRLSIFESQGKFQLYVDALEPAGMGALQLAFEALKAKLAKEGLFDPALKRPLPAWPRRIGICTSPTGAVIRDILHVAARRGRVRLLLAPCQVQGPSAPAEIRAALAALQRVPDIDVIILARGGGAAEDLAAFNDEALARAIRACRVPVVSAVGHEVDFSISDFVADLRAPTPSAAAEVVVPLLANLETRLDEALRRLLRAGARSIADGRLALDDELGQANKLLLQRIARDRRSLTDVQRRLAALHPRARLSADRAKLEALSNRLATAVRRRLTDRRRAFETSLGTLSALSPLRVLERGYSITKREDGRVVRDAAAVSSGDAIEVVLLRGALKARVLSSAQSAAQAADTKPPDSTR